MCVLFEVFCALHCLTRKVGKHNGNLCTTFLKPKFSSMIFVLNNFFTRYLQWHIEQWYFSLSFYAYTGVRSERRRKKRNKVDKVWMDYTKFIGNMPNNNIDGLGINIQYFTTLHLDTNTHMLTFDSFNWCARICMCIFPYIEFLANGIKKFSTT